MTERSVSEYVLRAVHFAIGEGVTHTLESAVREEIVNLWTDLDGALKDAINGRWSMQCDWLTERIALLTALTGAAVTTDELPETFPAGLFQEITQAIEEARAAR